MMIIGMMDIGTAARASTACVAALRLATPVARSNHRTNYRLVYTPFQDGGLTFNNPTSIGVKEVSRAVSHGGEAQHCSLFGARFGCAGPAASSRMTQAWSRARGGLLVIKSVDSLGKPRFGIVTLWLGRSCSYSS